MKKKIIKNPIIVIINRMLMMLVFWYNPRMIELSQFWSRASESIIIDIKETKLNEFMMVCHIYSTPKRKRCHSTLCDWNDEKQKNLALVYKINHDTEQFCQEKSNIYSKIPSSYNLKENWLYTDIIESKLIIYSASNLSFISKSKTS